MTKIKLSETLPNLLMRLWRFLSLRRRHQFLLLMGLMLTSAFAEIISLGAVLPFLGILVAPEKVFGINIISDLAQILSISTADQLVFPLTAALIFAALMAGATRLILLWANTRLAFATGSDLSIEIFRRSLYQPYQTHIILNSSEVISSITNKVSASVSVLYQFLLLISSSVMMIAVLLALIVIDLTVAMVAAISLGACYGLISWIFRKKLKSNSQLIALEQTNAIKTLQEGLGGIRDVLLDSSQSIYCNNYSKTDYRLRRAQGNNIFISGSPRFIMETFGIVTIAVIAYVFSQQDGGIATVLPVLGTFAVGAQRLLPAVQQMYNSWSSIIGNQASLEAVIKLLDQPLSEDMLQAVSAPLALEKSIHFKNVYFRYSSSTPWVLKDLSLIIPKGSRVGFVGSTGSGKSTTLDLLMGLLLPTKGEILVDGQTIGASCIRAWQKSIAHVPQNIYLTDATVAENIAFGVPLDRIDMERVKQSARQAQIADFIESTQKGYQAIVGERGIRLSGGQRQRIGIARALYKQASVLLFDEATSALDNATERSVIDAIESLNRDLTIIFIAHRLSTIKCCDMIVQLEYGRIVAHGAYKDFFWNKSSFFKHSGLV